MNVILINKQLVVLLLTVFITACATQAPRSKMDKATRAHPATERFIAFAKAANAGQPYEQLTKEFYLDSTQRQISKAMGWQKFAYSSAYRVLKDGSCDSIKLTDLKNRVQIDCIGTFLVRSMIIEDRIEAVHLRAYMIQQGSNWFLDKSGYVNTNAGVVPLAYSRSGIKFTSIFERQD